MQKIKNYSDRQKSRNGSYSVGITALVIAIIVIVNLIAGQIPENIKIWMSAVQKFMRFPRPAKSCLRTWITK